MIYYALFGVILLIFVFIFAHWYLNRTTKTGPFPTNITIPTTHYTCQQLIHVEEEPQFTSVDEDAYDPRKPGHVVTLVDAASVGD